jgi:hypothetical protein
VITYGTAAWHTPQRLRKGSVVQTIQKVQNKGLQAVARAYRATLIRKLKKEVLVPLINIYYSELRARHIRRIYSSLAKVFIQEQYKIIRGRLRRRRRKRAQPGQGSVTQEKIDWARQREQEYGCQRRKAVLTE